LIEHFCRLLRREKGWIAPARPAWVETPAARRRKTRISPAMLGATATSKLSNRTGNGRAGRPLVRRETTSEAR
jgi:hypothetical protein